MPIFILKSESMELWEAEFHKGAAELKITRKIILNYKLGDK